MRKTFFLPPSSVSKIVILVLISLLFILCSFIFSASVDDYNDSLPNENISDALDFTNNYTHFSGSADLGDDSFINSAFDTSSAEAAVSDTSSVPLELSQAPWPTVPPEGTFYIEMENILQKPELPTGCEATALTIVLNYLDYEVDKCDIVDNYMPRTTKKYSMNTHFIGDPYSRNGIGCYAPVVVITAENYFRRNGITNRTVKNITGASPEELYIYVSQGQPVICWCTIDMLNTYVAKTWVADDTGETVEFYLNEHATVLVGYNSEKKTVTLNDPWKGIVSYSMELFEKRYNQLGKQAIIIM